HRSARTPRVLPDDPAWHRAARAASLPGPDLGGTPGQPYPLGQGDGGEMIALRIAALLLLVVGSAAAPPVHEAVPSTELSDFTSERLAAQLRAALPMGTRLNVARELIVRRGAEIEVRQRFVSLGQEERLIGYKMIAVFPRGPCAVQLFFDEDQEL